MCKPKLSCHLLGDLFPPAEFIFSPNLKHLVLISLCLICIRFGVLFNNFRLAGHFLQYSSREFNVVPVK